MLHQESKFAVRAPAARILTLALMASVLCFSTCRLEPALITVSPEAVVLWVGESVALQAGSSDPSDSAFTWCSDATSVAQVDDAGVVIGIGPGTASITARGLHSGALAACAVSVLPHPAGEGEGESPGEGEGEGEGDAEGEGEDVVGVLGPDESFCGFFRMVDENPALDVLFPRLAELLGHVFVAEADLNGSVSLAIWPSLSCEIQGNGLPDAECELRLVEEVLKDPYFSLPNGLTHAQVRAAWEKNERQFASDFGDDWPMLGALLNGLPQILKGYMILGDGSAGDLATSGAELSGSVGFVQAVLALVKDAYPIPQLTLEGYTRLPGYFAKTGDADGDGPTNEQESVAAQGDPDAYVAAALDPDSPETGYQDGP